MAAAMPLPATRSVQCPDPDALPGQPSTELGALVTLTVSPSRHGDTPVNLQETARRWLAPFLDVSRVAQTADCLVVFGIVTDSARLRRNVEVGQVKLKGTTFNLILLSVEQAAAWADLLDCVDDSDDNMEASSWSSEFDSSSDDSQKDVAPWLRTTKPAKRPRTPDQKKQRNLRRKQARARKRSLSVSSPDLSTTVALPSVRAATDPVPHVPVPDESPAFHSVRAESDQPATTAPTATASSTVPVSIPVLSSVLTTDKGASDPAVPVSISSAVPVSVPVSSSVPTPDNGASAEVPATTNAARYKRAKKTRFTALDLSKVVVAVTVAPRDTFLFRPVDPSQSLSRTNPRHLTEQLASFGQYVEYREIRAGGLAVDFLPGTTDTAALLATTDVQGYTVTVSRPLDLHANACGVLTGVHPDLSSDDLMAALVTDVPALAFKRLAKPGQQSWVLKVTFAGPTTPKDVRLFGRRHVVKPYETRPLLCFNCSRFGHPARSCRSTTRCASCAGPHETKACPGLSSCCPNCSGNHSAADLTCPARAFQAKVLEVKKLHGTTFRVARSAVTKATRSYAAALGGPTPPPNAPGPHAIAAPPAPRLSARPASTQTDPDTTPPSQNESRIAHALHAVMTALASASASAELIMIVSQAFAPFLASPPSP